MLVAFEMLPSIIQFFWLPLIGNEKSWYVSVEFLFRLITEVREVIPGKTVVVVKQLEYVLESQQNNPGSDHHFYTELVSLRNDITNCWSLVSDTYMSGKCKISQSG